MPMEQQRSRAAEEPEPTLAWRLGTLLHTHVQLKSTCNCNGMQIASSTLQTSISSPFRLTCRLWQSHLRVTCGTCPISMMFPQRIRLRFTFLRSAQLKYLKDYTYRQRLSRLPGSLWRLKCLEQLPLHVCVCVCLYLCLLVWACPSS